MTGSSKAPCASFVACSPLLHSQRRVRCKVCQKVLVKIHLAATTCKHIQSRTMCDSVGTLSLPVNGHNVEMESVVRVQGQVDTLRFDREKKKKQRIDL